MKKILFLKQLLACTFILLLLVFSCKKDSLQTKINTNVADVKPTIDSNFVTLTTATMAAIKIQNSHLVSDIIKKKKVNSAGEVLSKQILDSLAVPDNINPSYYIFNYAGGGFAIISADKRVKPILAYSDNGYFPHSGKLPMGLLNWLIVDHKNMQLLKKNPQLKAPSGIAALWKEITTANTSDSGGKVTDKLAPPPPPCQSTWTTYTVGPFVQTEWGQDYPYNALCPAGNYSNGHMPTGCVATAIAQIMYYWQYPSRYNWSIMPINNFTATSSASNQAVAQLMVDIGTAEDMVYKVDGSYPSTYSIIPPRVGAIAPGSALKNSFGYSSATDDSYNYLNVVSSLNAHEPVLLGGTEDNTTILFWSFGEDGHSWVCDGYQQVTDTWCPSPGDPGGSIGYLYLHMNWGWDGLSDDTWQDFDYWSVFDGSGQKYWTHNQDMTYNIHP